MNLVLLLLLKTQSEEYFITPPPNFHSIPTRFLNQMVFFKGIITLGKSTESIGLKFCLGPHMTPGKDAQNYKRLSQIKFFRKILKIRQIYYYFFLRENA